MGSLRLGEYWEVARRRKSWIILTTVALFVGTAVFANRLPNIYRAETVILVDPQQVPDRYVTSTVSSNISDRLSTLKQQVLSPTRLKRLVDAMGLYPELQGKVREQQIIKTMQDAIAVEVVNPGGPRLSAFRIAYHGAKPAIVAEVTNRLAEMFIDENLRVRERQSEGTAEFLESELRNTKKQLQQKEEELGMIRSRNVLDLPESKQYHLEALTSLRTQLQASQDRVARGQQDIAILQSLALSSKSAPTIDMDAGQDGVGNSAYASQIQRLEMRLAELQGRYGSRHPDVVKAQKELEQLKANAEKEEKQTPAQISPKPEPGGRGPGGHNPVLQAQISKLQEEIEDQKRLQPRLQEQIDSHVSKLQRVPIFEQQIAGLLRDYDSLRAQYSSLLDKKLQADLSSALETHQKGERFVILDPAMAPEMPFAPNRKLLGLAGLLGGLLGGIALAVLAEMNDESVRSDSEAARLVGKPVLVDIPCMVSVRERRWERIRAVSTVAGTALGSGVVGFFFSYVLKFI